MYLLFSICHALTSMLIGVSKEKNIYYLETQRLAVLASCFVETNLRLKMLFFRIVFYLELLGFVWVYFLARLTGLCFIIWCVCNIVRKVMVTSLFVAI